MQMKYGFLSKIPFEQLLQWQTWLSAEKQKKLGQLPLFRQRQLICGEGFARLLLAKQLSIEPQAVQITYSLTGKPLTAGAWFSISHTNDLIVCAVDFVPLGIDVEKIRPVGQGVIQKLLPEQKSYIKNAPVGNEDEYFFRVWTAGEAYVKCLDKPWHAVLEAPLPTNDKTYCSSSLQFTFQRIATDYLLALCRQGKETLRAPFANRQNRA